MKYQEYNGWPNYATWVTASNVNSWVVMDSLAKQPGKIEKYIMTLFKDGDVSYGSSAKYFTDIVTLPISYANWPLIMRKMADDHLVELDIADLAIYTFLAQERDSSKHIDNLNDSGLKEYTTLVCFDWINHAKKLRKAQSPIAILGDTLCAETLASIVWEKVEAFFRGE